VQSGGGVRAAMMPAPLARNSTAVPTRRLAGGALVASALLDATMALTSSMSGLLALRFVEGLAHVTAITALMVAGAGEAAEPRPRRMAWLGMAMILGLAGGLFGGGRLASRE